MSTEKQAMIPSRDLESLRAGKCQDPGLLSHRGYPHPHRTGIYSPEKLNPTGVRFTKSRHRGKRVNLVAEIGSKHKCT